MSTGDIPLERFGMGLFDSFYDEDSKCPKCNAAITGGWQTKRLDSFLESWRKGDFLQYRKVERVPEKERKKEYRGTPFGSLRKTNEYLSDAPLVANGKVPVHTSCDKCRTELQAYAKVTNGKFDGIVEAMIDGREKQLVLIEADTTAQTIREEFERRLSHLQESCKHENSRWTRKNLAPGQSSGQVLVCLRCEKTLDSKKLKTQKQDPIHLAISSKKFASITPKDVERTSLREQSKKRSRPFMTRHSYFPRLERLCVCKVKQCKW